MTRKSAKGHTAAADVWRLMIESAMAQFGRASGILQQLGLTPGHMKALMMLQPGEPRPMGSLAQGFGCDASTMTWLVDRLEERELVERQGMTADRRVKAVALTPHGVRMKKKLEERLFRPPAAIMALDPAVLEILRGTLNGLVAKAESSHAGAEARSPTQPAALRRAAGPRNA
jgi:DNA-binding MarR family transcriptional regulator